MENDSDYGCHARSAYSLLDLDERGKIAFLKSSQRRVMRRRRRRGRGWRSILRKPDANSHGDWKEEVKMGKKQPRRKICLVSFAHFNFL